MKRIAIVLMTGVAAVLGLRAQVTVEACVTKAEANYPLISKYRLLELTSDIELSDINKSWLPRLGVYAQATVQNVVPSFPNTLSNVLEQMGSDVRGLGKLQYKAGLDLSQTVWDGGTSARRREVVRAQEAVQHDALDVELYAVRRRVENIFFATLLTQEQIAQSRVTLDILEANLERMRALLRGGMAMQADVDMVEAQALTLSQTISQAESALTGYRRVLELYTGEPLGDAQLMIPSPELPPDVTPDRPELRLFASQLRADRAAERLANTSLMPRFGLFAQAYYGYPGFNYFESMMNRDLSFNLLAGIKVSWNIDALYTRRNTARRTAVNAGRIDADREQFMFNTRLQTASQSEAIEGLRAVMADDDRIIALRTNVRKAAESQLANGIIDATAFLTKISDENLARLAARLHTIQLIQEIYNLKYTLNR